MEGAELLSLADTIQNADPRDLQTAAQIRDRLSSLQEQFERSHADDLAAYLDTCGHLVRLIGNKPKLEAGDVMEFVGKVVGAVAGELGVTTPKEASASRQPSPVEPPPVELSTAEDELYGGLEAAIPMRDDEGLPTLDTETPSSQPWRLMSRGFEEPRLRTSTEKLLGEIFLQLGMISNEPLEEGLERQRASGYRIGESLVDLGHMTWDQVTRAREVQKLLQRAAR